MNVTKSVHIDAPPATVWETITNVEATPEWTSTMTKVERLDAGPFTVGSRARITQPKLGTLEWTVTEIVLGRSFAWVSSKAGVRTVANHIVTPDGSGARLELQIAQTGPLAWLAAIFTKSLTLRYLTTEAEGCKRRSEELARA